MAGLALTQLLSSAGAEGVGAARATALKAETAMREYFIVDVNDLNCFVSEGSRGESGVSEVERLDAT